MIENEIIKHTKRAYAIFKSSGDSLRHKAVEIVIELLIIVTAVSISIWFHNWSVSRHNQKEEQEFLIGLKKDLQSDIEHMESSKLFYENAVLGMNYFLQTVGETAINKDSINKYSGIFFSSTNLDPQIGRYEGLKSSGSFNIIENKELLNSIIRLHETIIKRIDYLNEMYYQKSQKIEDIIARKVQFGENAKITNIESVINSGDFILILAVSKGLIENNIIPIHEEGINTCTDIISQIDKELE